MRGYSANRRLQVVLLSKAHTIGHLRPGEALLMLIRRRVESVKGCPYLAQAANRFRPFGQVAAGLRPVPHARLVSPIDNVRDRLSVREAGRAGAHRVPVPPDRQCPKREVGIALDRAGKKTIRLADLRDRPVHVEHEERGEADGTQPKARDADQAREGLRGPSSLVVKASPRVLWRKRPDAGVRVLRGFVPSRCRPLLGWALPRTAPRPGPPAGTPRKSAGRPRWR